MGRLKLLIGDEDKLYVENLAGYIMEKFPYKFQINCFTNIESFRKYFITNICNTDIVLAGSKFIDAIRVKDNIGVTDNKQDFKTVPVIVQIVEKNKTNEGNTVYKYTDGYSLTKKIISIYEKSMQPDTLQKKQHEVKVIAIYSPAGGTGKTTIAVKLSQCLSKEGFRLFYLSLESLNSQSSFFEERAENGSLNDQLLPEKQGDFSKLLFALKQRDEELSLKVKEVINYDDSGNIGYFPPPDSFLELDELDSSEIRLLLEELKQSGLFDIILMDLSSSFNYKSLTLIEESHEVIVVTTPDRIAVNKLISFLNDISLQQRRKGINFLDKILLVMNRWQENATNNQLLMVLNQNLSMKGKNFEIFLPDEKPHFLHDIDINYINMVGDFNRELYKIACRYH